MRMHHIIPASPQKRSQVVPCMQQGDRVVGSKRYGLVVKAAAFYLLDVWATGTGNIYRVSVVA
jgi:hypothetical protein